MTDSKLRELERRWKETGSTEDEAAYLLERVRVGDLDQEKLELAAYSGHEGARLALGDAAPQVSDDFGAWFQGLVEAGYPVTGCVCVSVAHLAREQGKGSDAEGAQAALRRAEERLAHGHEACPAATPRSLDFGVATERDWSFRVAALLADHAHGYVSSGRVPAALRIALARLGEQQSRERISIELTSWALALPPGPLRG